AQQPPDQIACLAFDDLRSLLGITGLPAFQDVVKVDRSIPQYNVGYGAVKQLIQRIEARSPGLYFAGNFSHGISVSDCIAAGAATAERIAGASSGQSSAAVPELVSAALSTGVS